MNRNKKNQREGRPTRPATVLTRLSITLTTALLFVAFAALPIAKGDTFTFVDGTDSLFIIHDGTDDTVGFFPPCSTNSLGQEGCGLVLHRGARETATLGGILSSGRVQIKDNSPSSVQISDVLDARLADPQEVDLTFESDPEITFAIGLGFCPSGSCQITEDGTVQTAGTISWSGDGPDDTIMFCSDVDDAANTCPTATPVPEPASILLLLSGLAGLAKSKYRSRIVS